MRQVDQLLEQAKQAMLYEITWAADFKVRQELGYSFCECTVYIISF